MQEKDLVMTTQFRLLASHFCPFFWSAFEVNFMDDVGQTLLNWASAFGTQEMVRIYLLKGFASSTLEALTLCHF